MEDGGIVANTDPKGSAGPKRVAAQRIATHGIACPDTVVAVGIEDAAQGTPQLPSFVHRFAQAELQAGFEAMLERNRASVQKRRVPQPPRCAPRLLVALLRRDITRLRRLHWRIRTFAVDPSRPGGTRSWGTRHVVEQLGVSQINAQNARANETQRSHQPKHRGKHLVPLPPIASREPHDSAQDIP